jgi:8-oxo-dGTP pyrophosphatase MutT (NUDIX family)
VSRRIEKRRAARLLVRDAEHRILMLLHEDKRGRRFWATPGGGIEEGETLLSAGRREAREELGLAAVALTEAWTDRIEFPFDDRWVEQTETFLAVATPAPALQLDVTEARWREGIREYRWWTLDDLDAATDQVVYPPDIVARLRARDSEESQST